MGTMRWRRLKSSRSLRDLSICCHLQTLANPNVPSLLPSLIWWLCSKGKVCFFRTISLGLNFVKVFWDSGSLLIIHWSYSFGWCLLSLLGDECTWHRFSVFVPHECSCIFKIMFQGYLLGGLSDSYYAPPPCLLHELRLQKHRIKRVHFCITTLYRVTIGRIVSYW